MTLPRYHEGWDLNWRSTPKNGEQTFFAHWWATVLSRTYLEQRRALTGNAEQVNRTALGRDPSKPIASMRFLINREAGEVWFYTGPNEVAPNLRLPFGDPGMVDVFRTFVDLGGVQEESVHDLFMRIL